MSVIQGPEAHRLVEEEGARLLDVRMPEELAEKSVPGAINVPVQELSMRLGELPDKGTPLVVFCRSGRRSEMAANLLRQAGWKRVYDLQTVDAW